MTTASNGNQLIYEMASAEFPDADVKSFNQAKEGQKPRWLSYVPDETVMRRLDEAFGPGRWTINAAPTPLPAVALVTLGVKWPDNDEWATYSDFGYPTNGERGEALKEAVSDGIRRCARYLGIARYIYAGEVEAHPPVQRPRPAAPSGGAGPAPKPIDAPFDQGDLQDIDEAADDTCRQHNVKWFTAKSGARMHQDGTWPDTGNKKWCIHPDDRNRKG